MSVVSGVHVSVKILVLPFAVLRVSLAFSRDSRKRRIERMLLIIPRGPSSAYTYIRAAAPWEATYGAGEC